MPLLSLADWSALAAFGVAWFFYEPLLQRLARAPGAINTDMAVIRRAWMAALVKRDIRLTDANLIGHSINSASFFGSANLILIAALAGALFGGDATWRTVSGIGAFAQAAPLVIELKLALVLLVLARGALDFVWAIRQLNYCLAVIGAAPDPTDRHRAQAFGDAAAQVINPALHAFSGGVRAYYFALAAAAWLIGPWALFLATLGAVGLLAWRQVLSPAARGLRSLRRVIEDDPR